MHPDLILASVWLTCSALLSFFKEEVESWWQVVYSPFAGDLLATEHFLGILAMEKAASKISHTVDLRLAMQTPHLPVSIGTLVAKATSAAN